MEEIGTGSSIKPVNRHPLWILMSIDTNMFLHMLKIIATELIPCEEGKCQLFMLWLLGGVILCKAHGKSK